MVAGEVTGANRTRSAESLAKRRHGETSLAALAVTVCRTEFKCVVAPEVGQRATFETPAAARQRCGKQHSGTRSGPQRTRLPSACSGPTLSSTKVIAGGIVLGSSVRDPVFAAEGAC